MKRHKAFILLLMFCVTSLLFACIPEGERARAMEPKLYEKVKNGVPANASRDDVEAFVATIQVYGDLPSLQEYSRDFSGFDTGLSAPHKPKEMPPNIVGHVIAKWGGVDFNVNTKQENGLYAIFYFDTSEHLVTFSVQRYSTN